jgi:sugar lactone lactonase YvrE
LATFEDVKISRRTLVGGGAAAAAGLALAGRVAGLAHAEDATPAAEGEGGGMPPLPAGATVVADGLWNPTDIAFGEDGTLYISESGVSGGGTPDETMATPNAMGTPVAVAEQLVPGQVTALTADGAKTVLATGLGGAIGIAATKETVYVATGGGSLGSGFAPLPIENTVNAIDIATGAVTQLAAIGPYEAEQNPDGTDINPNLYGLAIDADGLLYVTDAGGNTIYTVNPETKSFNLFAIVPNLDQLTGGTPGPESRQPVPTSLAIDQDGKITVGLLSMMWQGPSLLTYTPDGAYTVNNVNMAMVVDIALGPDGALYATQLSDDFTGEPPAPGSVKRIAADGTVETVIEGLLFPHGLAFDASGNLFVAVNSIISGPDAPLGQVLRFDGVAKSA